MLLENVGSRSRQGNTIAALFLVLSFLATDIRLVAATKAADQDKIDKVKADAAKRTGEKVVVTLKSGSKMKGIVSNVLTDSFDLLDAKTRQPTTIPFRDVEKVKKEGWSTGAKVALGAAIGAGVVIAIVFGALANDPFIGPICPLGC